MRRNKSMMKKKRTYPKMQVPGELLKKHIKFGDPPVNGMYLAYYKYWPDKQKDIFPVAGMQVAAFSEGKWGIQQQVLAWIGPMPVLSLDELASDSETNLSSFVTAPMKKMAKYEYSTGPHYQYVLAGLQKGAKGHFIFEMNSHRSCPYPIAKYNSKSGNWAKLKKAGQKKYLKILQLYIKKEMRS